MSTGTKIKPGISRVLFDTGLVLDATRDQYAAMPDGQRFLVLKSNGPSETLFNVIVNWPAMLKR